MSITVSMNDLAGKAYALEAVLASLMKTMSVSNPGTYESIISLIDENIEKPTNAAELKKGLREFKEALDRINVS